MTPVYEDMHANDIRRKKLKCMRQPKSRKQPEVYSVVLCVLCDHQACSFVRTYVIDDNERVP